MTDADQFRKERMIGFWFGFWASVMLTGITVAIFAGWWWSRPLAQAEEARDRCWRESAALECDDHPEVCVGKERADLVGVWHAHLPNRADHAPKYFAPPDAGP